MTGLKFKLAHKKARPIASSCREDVCFDLEVTLNNEFIGTIHRTPGAGQWIR